MKLPFVQHSDGFKQFHRFPADIGVINQRNTCFAIQSPFLGFFFPLVGIPVPVETDVFTCLDIKAERIVNRLLFLHPGFHFNLDLFFELNQLHGYRSIKSSHCWRTVSRWSNGTKFKTVSREGKRWCAVAVRIVDQHFGNVGYAQPHLLKFIYRNIVVFGAFFNFIENSGNLCSEKNRNNCRRRFIGS